MATRRNKHNSRQQHVKGSSNKDSGPGSEKITDSGPTSEKDGRLFLNLFVKPGAQSSEVTGVEQDAVHLRIAAAPRDGEANKEAVDFVARTLKVPRSAVQLVAGHKSRNKVVQLPQGLTADHVLDILRKG
ncbi:DUF167-domain-containing protein [Martensiomyces pterosporus]|nr:DUF167-domain-containing protein [Martensiomyces pterosporus]